ncbi:hypothetical protein GR160_12365 [Flavobacterium sp. Sd200]|uniref:hypothetical protein n=1 Tax=Flavobacterium sp. Sd200 TaxID=2692211 RepID=UPI00136B7DE0|nr:hypothetical protein [Flavobacterium sp. Sd200]MXN92020.1 hypothetical protein [Flavobacterium sp. Sd200]
MKKIFLLLLLFSLQIVRAQECSPVALPYTEDFESELYNLIPKCTSKEIIAGNSWAVRPHRSGTYNGNVLTYTPCYEQANAWFFSKPIYLAEGHVYKIEYLYGNNAPNTLEKFKVALATKHKPSAATVAVNKHTVKGACLNLGSNHEVCVPQSGIYYIAIKVESDAYQGELYVDELKIWE